MIIFCSSIKMAQEKAMRFPHQAEPAAAEPRACSFYQQTLCLIEDRDDSTGAPSHAKLCCVADRAVLAGRLAQVPISLQGCISLLINIMNMRM
jgi:hypothetical protein